MAEAGQTNAQRMAAFRQALWARDYAALPDLIGDDDPFRGTALFAAIGQMLDARRGRDIVQLAPLSDPSRGLSHQIWQVLARHFEGEEGALAPLMAEAPPVPKRHWPNARIWDVYATSSAFDIRADASGPGPQIIQFWDKADPPEDVADAMRSWQDIAGASYIRFTAEAAEDFLRDEFGPTQAALFQGAPHAAIKADYFRLGYLAARGGFYVDADTVARPLMAKAWPALSGKLVLMFQTSVPWIFIQNSFLAAPAGTRLFQRCFDAATKRLGQDINPDQLLALAGPFLITRTAAHMHKNGRLDPLETVSVREVRRHLWMDLPAAYKKDDRHWPKWQQGQT